MKKIIKTMLCALLVISLAGCSKNNTVSSVKEPEVTGSESGENQASQEETETKPVDLKIWHDGDEAIMGIIQTSLNESLKDKKITVTFEKKAGLTDQIKLYGTDAA
ncbi:MAG: ABC-type maltodextrin transport system, maltodextrin-binding periplasmic component, partial [Anaerocolumna sp.]|nr:ABC-type maltodextrin transport system, maltodextrin-binding periplasmic component [Anaerocolumna sp.]